MTRREEGRRGAGERERGHPGVRTITIVPIVYYNR